MTSMDHDVTATVEIEVKKKDNEQQSIEENISQKSISTINPESEKSPVAALDNSEEVKYFNGVEISKLTKRQMKKYLKTLKWEARKKEKRANERLKTKKRKMEAKLNNIDLGPSRKQLKRSKMVDSPCKIGVVIDLSFDHLMISKVYTNSYFNIV